MVPELYLDRSLRGLSAWAVPDLLVGEIIQNFIISLIVGWDEKVNFPLQFLRQSH
jgi:hypothetical protein